jgi:UPF0716 protein FxsA
VLLKLLALFILLPLVELWLLLVLARHTSVGFTLLLVVLTGVTGTLLARSQGWRTLLALRAEVARGTFPAETLVDAAMIFLAGVLLLTPGLITDAAGITLLIPACRRFYRRKCWQWLREHVRLEAWTTGAEANRSQVVDTTLGDRRDDP